MDLFLPSFSDLTSGSPQLNAMAPPHTDFYGHVRMPIWSTDCPGNLFDMSILLEPSTVPFDPSKVLPGPLPGRPATMRTTHVMHPKLVSTIKSLISNSSSSSSYEDSSRASTSEGSSGERANNSLSRKQETNFEVQDVSTCEYDTRFPVVTTHNVGEEEKEAAVVSVELIRNLRPYKCQYTGCTKAFKNQQTMKMHHKTHDWDAAWDAVSLCPRPGKSHVLSSALSPTSKSGHNKKIPSGCPVCKRSFVGLYELRRHFGRRHSVGEKTFGCRKCDKKFWIEVDLRDHQKLCGEPLECKCGMKFAFKCNLVQHKKIHPACQDQSPNEEEKPSSVTIQQQQPRLPAEDCAHEEEKPSSVTTQQQQPRLLAEDCATRKASHAPRKASRRSTPADLHFQRVPPAASLPPIRTSTLPDLHFQRVPPAASLPRILADSHLQKVPVAGPPRRPPPPCSDFHRLGGFDTSPCTPDFSPVTPESSLECYPVSPDISESLDDYSAFVEEYEFNEARKARRARKDFVYCGLSAVVEESKARKARKLSEVQMQSGQIGELPKWGMNSGQNFGSSINSTVVSNLSIKRGSPVTAGFLPEVEEYEARNVRNYKLCGLFGLLDEHALRGMNSGQNLGSSSDSTFVPHLSIKRGSLASDSSVPPVTPHSSPSSSNSTFVPDISSKRWSPVAVFDFYAE